MKSVLVWSAIILSVFSVGQAVILFQTSAQTGDEHTSLQRVDPDRKGPHGGSLLRQENREYEFALNKETKQLDVFTPTESAINPGSTASMIMATQPKSMGVTLIKDDNTTQTIQLRSLPPTPDGFYHYQGRLSQSEGSSIAFGIKFDFDPLKTTEENKKESEQP